jgi:hypothetical protein
MLRLSNSGTLMDGCIEEDMATELIGKARRAIDK